jgi:AcrR family transcriptional regulator
MRERLLEAASGLFYAQGLRAVSADKIIDAVGTTKVTFYRHFRTKDDLVVAYLSLRAEQERAAVDEAVARSDGDPQTALRLIAEGCHAVAGSPGFRGCPFINAAAEYPDPDSAVRQIVAAHRQWFQAMFLKIVEPMELDDPDAVAEQLMLLRDGALVAGYLGSPLQVGPSLLRGWQVATGRPGAWDT